MPWRRLQANWYIDVADFGYAPGIEKLREIAGLKSISTEVPVDVKLVFVHETS